MPGYRPGGVGGVRGPGAAEPAVLYSLVVYLAALRVALPALFGVALYFWQRVGRALAPGQRRWVNGAALLAACLCAWLGFSLMWIEFTGYVGLWLFMALLLCALLGDLGAG